MAAVAHYVEVNAPARACYDWWRPFTRLPEIMDDVKKVEPIDGAGDRTRWTVSGPLGKSLSWDATIAEDSPPHTIAWTTLDSSDPDVKSSGVVRFDDKGNGVTGVEVSFEYHPPAGKLGEAVASLFDDPQAKVRKAVDEFKIVIEAR